LGERFVGEPLLPRVETADASRMALGEPGLPTEFEWRGRRLRVRACLRAWRETGPCRHGSGERYVRKHWYELATESDGVLRVYFDRQPRPGSRGPRWWLFSVLDPGPEEALR
jgi:phosphoribosylglycinamide formyltransferase-1